MDAMVVQCHRFVAVSWPLAVDRHRKFRLPPCAYISRLLLPSSKFCGPIALDFPLVDEECGSELAGFESKLLNIPLNGQ